MKRIKEIDNLLILFLGAGLFTILLYLALSFFDKATYIYAFFFRAWQIQALSTYLFGTAILFIILKFYHLKTEKKVANIIDIKSMTTISYDKAKEWLDRVPSKYRQTIGFRRMSELLRGYLNREEVIRLNEELSRRDVEQVDRGHLLLNSIRQLIPVIGFLGTVLGLSLGMVKFPEHISQSGNIENLRNILKDFAASLSVAFDTTLLALGYTIVVIILSSLLREREESFVAEVDEKAREMIAKFKSEEFSSNNPINNIEGVLSRIAVTFQQQLQKGINMALEEWTSKWERGFSNGLREILNQQSTKNGNLSKEVVEVLRQNGDELVRKLEGIKEGLHKPPRYEIIVQPLKGEAHE